MASNQYEIAKAVRLATEKRTRLKSLKNRCGVASTALHVLWAGAGIESELICGWYVAPSPTFDKLVFGNPDHIKLAKSYRPPEQLEHCWVECRKQIWDLTLTQFELDADPISRLCKPDARFRKSHSVSREAAYMNLSMIGVDELCKQVMSESVETMHALGFSSQKRIDCHKTQHPESGLYGI